MDYGVDPAQGLFHGSSVSYIADDQFRFGVEIVGPLPAGAVHLGGKIIEDTDGVSAAEQLVSGVGADETRSACD
jgi:hypothetical protein